MKKKITEEELDRFNSREIAEQTLLAWIQSGLTLVGFGFAMGSLIALMKAEHYEKIIVKSIRIIALLLIVLGVASILLALIQHKGKVGSIKEKKYYYKHSFSLPTAIGLVICMLGTAAFLAILIHMIF